MGPKELRFRNSRKKIPFRSERIASFSCSFLREGGKGLWRPPATRRNFSKQGKKKFTSFRDREIVGEVDAHFKVWRSQILFGILLLVIGSFRSFLKRFFFRLNFRSVANIKRLFWSLMKNFITEWNLRTIAKFHFENLYWKL